MKAALTARFLAGTLAAAFFAGAADLTALTFFAGAAFLAGAFFAVAIVRSSLGK
jgi:hypothetical protein